MSDAAPHILICNERIVFRYGVDRILIELARTLVAEGWRVTIVCLRCERDVVRAITPHIRIVESAGGDLYQVESDCARFLDENWSKIEKEGPVDAIVCGGWPFFHVCALGERRGVPTVFIDAGSVPHDGLNENAMAAQRAVRRMRALSLPRFDRVLPISDFIKESQTIPDRSSSADVHVVRLGVDHLASKVFAASESLSRDEEFQIARLERLAARKTALILNLGRFEAEGYKNSPASFLLLRELLRRARDADGGDFCLLLLGRAEEIDVPQDLQSHVVCLGSPSDDALDRVMGLAHVGFSPSLWEGFNLPIGEMQILEKPVFAFNVGAHPEVVLHPWFLCATVAEAAEKIERALSGRLPHGVFDAARVSAYRERFAWRNATTAYRAHLLDAISRRKRRSRQNLLFVDVTNSSRDTANSGVVRVTRRLSAQLQAAGDARLLFVYWDADIGAYRFVAGAREGLLAAYHGPDAALGALAPWSETETTPEELLVRLPDAARRATLLLPEVVLDGQAARRIEWARRLGVRTAAILYDLIPIEFPQYCGEALRETFPSYIEALAQTDRVIAISGYSLECFKSYAARAGLEAPARMEVAWLPGQLAASKRVKTATPDKPSDVVSIVCVSTIEPRKNHRALLAAYRRLRKSAPGLPLSLTLIGNAYRGAEEFAEAVREAVAGDPTIRWLVAISDDELIEEMRRAAFTVYPSLVEGFGLPILESLWAAKPCICHDKGVMAELAAGGGCLSVDMTDVDALVSAMKALATDGPLLSRLAQEARGREIADWSDYARSVARLLWPDATATLDPAPERTEKARIEREANFWRHRLNGVGLLGEKAAPASSAPEPRAAESASIVPRVVTTRPTSVWARLFSRSRLTAQKLASSGLFDAEWYLSEYPDVREAGVDPLVHFVKFGHREGRSPGPNFDSQKYFAENPTIEGANLSPLEHYLANRGKR